MQISQKFGGIFPTCKLYQSHFTDLKIASKKSYQRCREAMHVGTMPMMMEAEIDGLELQAMGDKDC